MSPISSPRSFFSRLIGAALPAAMLIMLAPLSHADIVVQRDGKVLPNKVASKVKPNTIPSDAVLKDSGRDNADLTYTTVKVGRDSMSASLVKEVFATSAYSNPDYNHGEEEAARGNFEQAAEAFKRAADELKGAANQIALYRRVLCYWFGRKPAQIISSTNDLLTAHPKSYYLAEVETYRARVLIGKKNGKGAKAALEKVINTKGMNARDYFQAKITLVDFFVLSGASDDAGYKAAFNAYSEILREFGSRNGDREAPTQKLKCMLGVAKCLLLQNQPKKAEKYFNDIINSPASSGATELLAGAYRGRGDVRYMAVKAKLSAGETDKGQLPAVMEELTLASMDYLRVARFYGEDAGDELTPSMLNCARVWATQFTLDGEKDLDLGIEAERMFRDAHRRTPRGEGRRVLTREITTFMAKVKELRMSKEKKPAGATK